MQRIWKQAIKLSLTGSKNQNLNPQHNIVSHHVMISDDLAIHIILRILKHCTNLPFLERSKHPAARHYYF